MKIIYRISDTGYKKEKLSGINNENCLRNFCNKFRDYNSDIHIIADNVSSETYNMVKRYVPEENIVKVSVGHGGGTFNLALGVSLNFQDSEIVYFVENDYIHLDNSAQVLLEGFGLGADFVTLYDHLDKYFDGPNPYVQQGGEDTKVFLSKSCHWKLTNSTTMTFASKVNTIRKYEYVFRDHTNTSLPKDFNMWIALRELGLSLVSPIPSYSTHGDLPTLAPLFDWSHEI